MCKKEVLSQILLPLGNLSFLSFSFWPCFQVDWDVEVVVVVVNVVVVVVVVDVLNGFAETFKTIFSVTGGRKKAEMGFGIGPKRPKKSETGSKKKSDLISLQPENFKWEPELRFCTFGWKSRRFLGSFPKKKINRHWILQETHSDVTIWQLA